MFILIPSAVCAQGDRWQYILSPGALNPYHSYISGIINCTRCHEIPQGISEEKCLECHREIRERRESLRGYHGTLSLDCFQCHTEHQENIIKNFDNKKFDHTKSLFLLSGKHAHTECEKCHLKEEKRTGMKRFTYLGISMECIGCHENIHRTSSMEKCGHCHSQEDWQKTSFNHDIDTKYTLDGLHRSIDCKICHKGNDSSSGTKVFSIEGFESCLACHKDTHEGTLSADCLVCHGMKGWKPAVFLHDNSAYKLKGAHIKVRCDACHEQGRYRGIKHDTCAACHQKTSHNRLHEPCTSCHTEEKWSTLIKGWDKNADKHAAYNYQLEGAHLKAQCSVCHIKTDIPRYFGIKHDNCIDCHRDEHKGQFQDRRCEACHVVEDFKKLTFDHERTEFKLEQLHGKVKCESCHREKQYTSVPIACESCHKDIARFYKGIFGKNSPPLPSPKSRIVGCDKCHETDIKDFKVDGAKCLSCHERHYDDFFNAWEGFLKMDISGLSEKVKRLFDCKTIPQNNQKEIEKVMDGLSFLEKNLHHNYRLSAMVINEYMGFLEGTEQEDCRE